MAGKFPRDEVSKLLVQCHRRCCICHRFCGSKMETDHIEQPAEGGDDSIENAIPVCFECHAEIHSYNPDHPRGRKFYPNELRGHRDQWLTLCETRPEVLLAASWEIDVGPLQALVDELEYNRAVAEQELAQPEHSLGGALFQEMQFNRAVSAGVISVLHVDLKRAINNVYALMNRANQLRLGTLAQDTRTRGETGTPAIARKALEEAKPMIDQALNELMQFL